MLKMSYAGCPGPSSAISSQFSLKMWVAARNRKKFTKSPYFGGSRSCKVIDVNINKKPVTIACYKQQPKDCKKFTKNPLLGVHNR